MPFIESSLIIINEILFLALIATGAFLIREEMRLPEVVLNTHQAAPLLALVSSTAGIYLTV